MAVNEEEIPASEPDAGASPRRKRLNRLAAVLAGVSVLGLGGVWLARERLADRLIAGQLESLGLPATYTIESIGPRAQVLTNVVVGDKGRPDLTIERAVIEITPRLGIPAIDRVTLIRPRLYGSLRGGKPSFGSLDKVLFTGSDKAFRLPKLNLLLDDGRARLLTDYGPVGIKAAGSGELRGGFAGMIAVAAPRLLAGGCDVRGASLYGTLKVRAERPEFAGPARAAQFDCAAQDFSASRAALGLSLRFDQSLDGAEGTMALATSKLRQGARSFTGLNGSSALVWRGGKLAADYNFLARGLTAPEATAATLGLAGKLNAEDGFARVSAKGTADGGGVRLGSGVDRALGTAQSAAQGSFAAAMIGQIRTALAREGRNSRLDLTYDVARNGKIVAALVPAATLRGGSGAALLTLSDVSAVVPGKGAPRITGNVTTGGAGLPRIAGRIEQRSAGSLIARLRMDPYRAGGDVLAVPQLTLVQARGGALGFAGSARLTGALPGGRAENMILPLDGNWSAANGLAVWRGCTPLAFDRLSYANFTLDRQRLTLCPGPGGAILRSDARGLRVAAGAPALNVSGRLGSTPIRIASGPVGFAIPGAMAARRLDISLGPVATATRFQIDNLTAQIGKEIAGKFAGSDVRLFAVPLDLLGASGNWRYAGGKLSIDGGDFTLEDRVVDDRFQPLVAQGATLSLLDNRILANALLREPRSQREVTQVAINHDLATGRGFADLAVPGITFDKALQPDTLTRLALGVVANARGTVAGTGRIDWTPRGVTSTGRFATDAMDFAAAFGPVKGASGTIVFTDLLGLVTAPDQQLQIASVNPGIEVNDGLLTYQLEPNSVLMIKGVRWPFLDGTLELQPVRMQLGVAETRRYVLKVEGLNASKFVERMELGNLSATGIFDGELPLVFDESGGRIEGGLLNARPPGGNISYIGALTYKDLSAMANFAFDALKSLDYKQMRIAMDGSLEGEIVTRVRFDGVKQGAGAKRNFITRRFANLPLQFNVNVRAPFQKLITSFKSLYDPAFVKDPRSLTDAKGQPLLNADGTPYSGPMVPIIQPSDSRNKP